MLKIRGGFFIEKRISLIVRMRTNRGSTLFLLVKLKIVHEQNSEMIVNISTFKPL